MKKILLLLIIPLLSHSQNEEMQSMGTLVTYVIYCPCKLFKYYEDGNLFYSCEDKVSNTKYVIKELKHQDGIDVVLNSLHQNIKPSGKQKFDSIVESEKIRVIHEYLQTNHNSISIDFMGGSAALVDSEFEKKIFFSDEEFIVSYEIIVSGKNSDSLSWLFNKSIESIMPKKDYLKRIF